jgi:hypothetical protein
MTLTNKALQQLTDFAVAFNKNAFSLSVGGALDIRPALFPNQSYEAAIPLRINGLAQQNDPINSND